METRRRSERPCTIGDAMILIAAVAMSAALLTLRIDEDECACDYLLDVFESPQEGWTPVVIADDICSVTLPLNLCLAPSTFAVLVLRLRHPRPAWRRLGREPGTLATLLGSMSASVMALTVTLGVVFAAHPDWAAVIEIISGMVSSFVAAPIAGGWIATAIIGGWRPTSSWLDRTGRFIGVLWIVIGISGGLSSGYLVLKDLH
jgi:hypothetical protein